MPVIYDTKAGKTGRTHGETKLKTPAPKASKIVTFVPIKIPPFRLSISNLDEGMNGFKPLNMTNYCSLFCN